MHRHRSGCRVGCCARLQLFCDVCDFWLHMFRGLFFNRIHFSSFWRTAKVFSHSSPITTSRISFVSKCYLAFSRLIKAGLRPMTILQIAYIDWLWAPFPPSKKAGWSLAGFCIKNTKWRFLSLASAKKSPFWRARPLHQILNEACSVAACAVEHINWALAKLRLGLNLLAFRI